MLVLIDDSLIKNYNNSMIPRTNNSNNNNNMIQFILLEVVYICMCTAPFLQEDLITLR